MINPYSIAYERAYRAGGNDKPRPPCLRGEEADMEAGYRAGRADSRLPEPEPPPTRKEVDDNAP